MGEEFGICEVEQAGGVIGHDICDARDEGELVAVAVVALMEGGQLADVSRRPFGGGTPFEVPGQRRGVVGQ